MLDERNRIAREIHDTLAQTFMGILLELRVALRIAPERPEEAWRLVAHVAELSEQGAAEARRSVWALQPDEADHADVQARLGEAVDRARSGSAADITLQVGGRARRVPPDVGQSLLRIAEEAIANALRHGNAQLVLVGLEFSASEVRLRVQDDGCGFDPEQQADSGGFGLIGMAQRAARLGGRLTIAGRPGRGTEILVAVPAGPVPARSTR